MSDIENEKPHKPQPQVKNEGQPSMSYLGCVSGLASGTGLTCLAGLVGCGAAILKSFSEQDPSQNIDECYNGFLAGCAVIPTIPFVCRHLTVPYDYKGAPQKTEP